MHTPSGPTVAVTDNVGLCNLPILGEKTLKVLFLNIERQVSYENAVAVGDGGAARELAQGQRRNAREGNRGLSEARESAEEGRSGGGASNERARSSFQSPEAESTATHSSVTTCSNHIADILCSPSEAGHVFKTVERRDERAKIPRFFSFCHFARPSSRPVISLEWPIQSGLCLLDSQSSRLCLPER
jgi:hypothetical protein